MMKQIRPHSKHQALMPGWVARINAMKWVFNASHQWFIRYNYQFDSYSLNHTVWISGEFICIIGATTSAHFLPSVWGKGTFNLTECRYRGECFLMASGGKYESILLFHYKILSIYTLHNWKPNKLLAHDGFLFSFTMSLKMSDQKDRSKMADRKWPTENDRFRRYRIYKWYIAYNIAKWT